jgi:ankyrin repeat protein
MSLQPALCRLILVATLATTGMPLPATADPDLDRQLINAAEAQDLVKVSQLLGQGASVDASNKYGTRGIEFAAFKGNLALIRMFIAAGSEINQHRGKKGNLVLQAASGDRGSPAVVNALLDAGARVNDTNMDGDTALGEACYSGNLAVVQALLAAGAKVDIANKDGVQAIHLASNKGYEVRHANGHERIVKLLLEAGAKVDAKDNRGWQPIHYAADGANSFLVEILAAAGADMNAATLDGKTPMRLAQARDYSNVIKALVVAGASAEH